MLQTDTKKGIPAVDLLERSKTISVEESKQQLRKVFG